MLKVSEFSVDLFTVERPSTSRSLQLAMRCCSNTSGFSGTTVGSVNLMPSVLMSPLSFTAVSL